MTTLLGCVVEMNAGHVSGTRGSGIVSIIADVLWMREVDGVCNMYICLASGRRGWRGG